MCYGGLYFLNVDDMWDLFEYLASYRWQHACDNESFACPSPPPYYSHAQSTYTDQFRDACDHYSSYPLDACSYCQSFDYDVKSYPYYDISDESYAKLDAMTETTNERHEHFVSEMREFGLLHETDPSLPIPMLESSLYDDYESSLLLESNIVDDAPLTDLEEVLDPPLTYSPLVAPSSSSTPIVTSTSDSTLLDFPFPLAQCTGLEMGETSRGDVSVLEDASLLRSKELTLVESHLEEAPLEELCADLVMGIDTLSIGCTNPIGNEPLDLTPTSPPLPPTIPSYLHAFYESLGDIKGYNPSLNIVHT